MDTTIVTDPIVPSDNWMTQFQEKAAEKAASLDWPKRKDEHWRFASLKRADISRFEQATLVEAALNQELRDASGSLNDASARYTFVNGKLSDVTAPEGRFFVGTFEQAEAEFGDLVHQELERLQDSLGAEKYIAMQQSRQMGGLFIHVPRGVRIEQPVEIDRWVVGDQNAILPATIVVTEDNAQVTVFERVRSVGSGEKLAIGTTSLTAGNGASIDYTLSQELSAESSHVHAMRTTAGRDANIRAFTGNFGSWWIRQETIVDVAGPGSNSEVFGANIALGDQEVDQRTYQHHREGNSRSDLFFKNALYDKAKTIFSGLILVEEGAHHTDAFQTCRNLVLSNEAESNSLPGLEINADQVKCSHGATNGQLDPEELFYLMARGIREDRARELITLGFINGAISKVRDEGVREILLANAERRLAEAQA